MTLIMKRVRPRAPKYFFVEKNFGKPKRVRLLFKSTGPHYDITFPGVGPGAVGTNGTRTRTHDEKGEQRMRRGRPPLGERSGIAERASIYMDASLAAQLRTYMSMYQVFNKAEALRQLVVFALERTLETPDGAVVTPKQVISEKQKAMIESAEMLGEAKPIFTDHIGSVYPIPYYKPSADEDDPNSYVRECPICNSTTDIHDDGGISWWCDSCRWSGTFVHKADDTYELKVTHKKKPKVA